MQRLGAAAELGEIVAFQDVEHLDQVHAAGGGRRHRDDVVAAIACRAPAARSIGAIILQIVVGHDAAGGAHRGGDLVRRCGPRRTRAGRLSAIALSVSARSGCTSRSPCSSGAPSLLRKIAADDGQRASRSRDRGSESARSSSTGKPSRASAIAGAIRSASENLPEPYFACASASPATVPGTPTASAGVARLLRIGIALRVEEHVARRGRRRGLAIVDGDVAHWPWRDGSP